VFLQILDPALFAGSSAFGRQTQWVADACHAATPMPGVARVRLPGEAGLARRARALAEGVQLHPGIMGQLEPWARDLGVALPREGS